MAKKSKTTSEDEALQRQSRKEILIARKNERQLRNIRIAVITVAALIVLVLGIAAVNEFFLIPNRAVATVGDTAIPLRAWDARVKQAGVGVSGADIVIGGEIRDFSTNAKSRVFNTKLTGESRLVIKARNLADDSSTVRNIQGEQTKLVFWFTSEDVETLMSGLLQDGIERFITDTKIEGRTLKSAK